MLVQRTMVPVAQAPDSCCVVISAAEGGYTRHFFDSRGVARLYAMSFDGRTWTLQRSTPDFSPLDFHQRLLGSISDDGTGVGLSCLPRTRNSVCDRLATAPGSFPAYRGHYKANEHTELDG